MGANPVQQCVRAPTVPQTGSTPPPGTGGFGLAAGGDRGQHGFSRFGGRVGHFLSRASSGVGLEMADVRGGLGGHQRCRDHKLLRGSNGGRDILCFLLGPDVDPRARETASAAANTKAAGDGVRSLSPAESAKS